jgi:hypothetical protein
MFMMTITIIEEVAEVVTEDAAVVAEAEEPPSAKWLITCSRSLPEASWVTAWWILSPKAGKTESSILVPLAREDPNGRNKELSS